MKTLIAFLLSSLLFLTTSAQGVKIGGSGLPEATAILELDGGGNKGFLMPRLDQTQMAALSNAPNGMVIYNTTDASLYLRKNSAWQKLAEGNGAGGFSLPYTGTHNLSAAYTFDLTNSSATGGALAGRAGGSGAGGFFTSASGPALLTGNGNVGIGLSTPAYPLTLASNSNGFVQKGSSVEVGTAVSAFAGYLKTFTNHPLHFATNNGPSQMVLSVDGSLALGTALPFSKLHIKAATDNLQLLENANTLASDVQAMTYFKTGASYTGAIGTVGTSSTAARLGFWTSATSSPALLDERLSIADNGNVGINNSSPSQKLDVNGSARVTGSLQVNGSLTNHGTGSANLLPIAIGKVDFTGSVLGGTGNFTVQQVSAGQIKIVLTNQSNVYNDKNKYIVMLSSNTWARMLSSDIQSDNSILVEIVKPHISYGNKSCDCGTVSLITSTEAAESSNGAFSFTVYKM